MDAPLQRPASGIWRELWSLGARRTLAGLAVALVGPALLSLLPARLEMPAGIYVLAVIPAAVVGRLWGGILAPVASFAGMVLARPSDGFRPQSFDWILLGVLLFIGVLVAIEEAARARARLGEQRLAFLAEANRTLTTSLDTTRTVADLAELVVPRFADWCWVRLRDREGNVTQRVTHVDPKRVRLVEELAERYPPDPSLRDDALAAAQWGGRSIVLSRVSVRRLARIARDGEHSRLLRSLGIRSAVVVPIVGRDGPFGFVLMAAAESGRRYGSGDLTFAEELARTAAMGLESAKLHEERSRIAQTLQNSLLPSELPQIPGVEVSARYRPAGEGNLVGGDFYDVFDAGDVSWAVAVGDVCGKGPEAAALTGLVRHSLRTAAIREGSPAQVLEVVNRQIMRDESDRFCTVALGRVSRLDEKVEVTVSCAGHPPPLVFRPMGAVEAVDCLGTVLGVFPEATLVDRTIPLEPGDAIVFYTDGVTERFDRDGDGGDAHLVSVLWASGEADASSIADRIYRDAALARPERPRDDIAIVVLRAVPGR